MTTPLPPASLLSAAPIPMEVKRKRVLLVDTSQAKRELRAEVMRKSGIDVDCAADIAEARSWWRAALYDLVLINMENGRGYRDKFCDEIRSATPPQRLAFLVGEPEYLADLPSVVEGSPEQISDGLMDDPIMRDFKLNVAADRSNPTQRWGILEASRRISAVRSSSLARTQAMRALPAPARDSEGRPAKRNPTATSLDDLMREVLR
jgi:CheY-like chemotaxis protein